VKNILRVQKDYDIKKWKCSINEKWAPCFVGYNIHEGLRNGITLQDTMSSLGGKSSIKHPLHVVKCTFCRIKIMQIRGVGYKDVVQALLPYRNVTKMFLPTFYFKNIFHTSKY
jgi:hypothetical protein